MDQLYQLENGMLAMLWSLIKKQFIIYEDTPIEVS